MTAIYFNKSASLQKQSLSNLPQPLILLTELIIFLPLLKSFFLFSFIAGISTTSTMRWSRWKASIIFFILGLVTKLTLAASSQYNQNFKISPKPCTVSGVEGTCMFVWECIKSEGLHLGMCMDGFMFGSCCGHNLTANFILPPSTPFRPQFKPTAPIRIKPTKFPNKPNNHGTLTIQRPNGSGTLVIRQPPKPQRPIKTKPPTRRPTTTKSPLDNFNDSSNELISSASVSASKF